MIKASELAGIFFKNGQPISPFLFIGIGQNYPADFKKGAIIASLISSRALSNAYKNINEKREDGVGANEAIVYQQSLTQFDIQIDCYKENAQGYDGNHAYNEACKLYEHLKTWDAQEYLRVIGCEVLPCYSLINTTTELTEQKQLVQRAFFEFSIIRTIETAQSVGVISQININGGIYGTKHIIK